MYPKKPNSLRSYKKANIDSIRPLFRQIEITSCPGYNGWSNSPESVAGFTGIRNTLKFPGIMGDQGRLIGQSGTSNQNIHWTDNIALFFKNISYLSG